MISPIFLIIATVLSIVNLSACRFCADLESHKIRLISPVYRYENFSSTMHMELNDMFFNMCSDYYDIVYEYVNNDKRMETIKKMINANCNVIDLFVPDNNNLVSYIDSLNIIYAGGNYVNRSNANDFLINTAKVINMRASEMNSGDLLDFVSKIVIDTNPITNDIKIKTRESCLETSGSEINLPIVLVCSEIKTLRFASLLDRRLMLYRFVKTNDCVNSILRFNNYLLTVIAPKPFELHTEFSVPTIFYELPYITLEYKTSFPNSFNLMSPILIKDVFIKLMEDFGWARIAIISDDSEYSYIFENELVQIFKEKEIVYNVQSCERTCNFTKAIENLKNLNAKIVIANVDEENARRFYYFIPQDFYVLFRIPPMKNIRSLSDKNHLFVSLETIAQKDCGRNDNTCKGIVQSLTILKKVYTRTTCNYISFKNGRDYYSNLKEKMMKFVSSEAIAVVKRFNGKPLLSMYVNRSGIDKNSVKKYEEPYQNIPYDNVVGYCFTKTNDYANYCDINILLYFMYVIVIFGITFILITCYFHKTSPVNAINYQQF